MMKYWLVAILLVCSATNAQFLPASKLPPKPLTNEVLSRWMETNKIIHDYQTLIDEMLPTENEAKAFDQLSAVEQDALVNKYLHRKGMFEPLNSNLIKLGWTGVADYMRASTQIGNAIAADLQAERVKQLTPDQAKAVLEKTDPAVKAVTSADLNFIRVNKAKISEHFKSYSSAK